MTAQCQTRRSASRQRLTLALAAIALGSCMPAATQRQLSAGTDRTNAELAQRQKRDCTDCPALVLIPAGSFIMGMNGGETGRPEGPAHEVTIARPFWLAAYEVTQGEFARFADATGFIPDSSCTTWPAGSRDVHKVTWRAPYQSANGAPADKPAPQDAVVCISWRDAQDYIRWLNAQSGQSFRLPTEAEWEYAARAGTTGAFHWGDDPDDGCGHANMNDIAAAGLFDWGQANCDDGQRFVAPVGSYAANDFQLHDMLGNVWEWTQDCYVAPYPEGHGQAAIEPIDGEACARRSVRGGSWMTRPDRNRASFRGRDPEDTRYFMFGFRLARDLTAQEQERLDNEG